MPQKKEQRDLIDNHLPRHIFWKYNGHAHPDRLWFPHFNSFTGSVRNGELAAAYPLRKNSSRSIPNLGQTINPAQEMLLGTTSPFLIFHGGSFYDVPMHDRGHLPPDDLGLIDCFPHADTDWKKFLARKKEYVTPDNFLVEALGENLPPQVGEALKNPHSLEIL